MVGGGKEEEVGEKGRGIYMQGKEKKGEEEKCRKFSKLCLITDNDLNFHLVQSEVGK